MKNLPFSNSICYFLWVMMSMIKTIETGQPPNQLEGIAESSCTLKHIQNPTYSIIVTPSNTWLATHGNYQWLTVMNFSPRLLPFRLSQEQAQLQLQLHEQLDGGI